MAAAASAKHVKLEQMVLTNAKKKKLEEQINDNEYQWLSFMSSRQYQPE